jgi:hypothetical protein
MVKISLEILDQTGQVKQGKNDYEAFNREMCVSGTNEVHLTTQDLRLTVGDKASVKLSEAGQYLVVRLDETLAPSLIFIKGDTWTYQFPLAENDLEAKPDIAFTGKRHSFQVRLAYDFEIKNYQNLTLNPHDQKDESGAYPHASANVETRNDATFFAKNAIDGYYGNQSHGSYPYQSWGINQQLDAALTIDFGREVEIDRIAFVFRADFPHDSYWTSVTLSFDNGIRQTFETTNSDSRQAFDISAVKTRQVTFEKLIQADDASPFPALTQLEAFGRNIEG